MNSPNHPHDPINSLPDELLSHIFLHRYQTPPNNHGRRRPSWLNVAGVCRRWRQVALNTPRFWSQIDLEDSIPDAREFLRRSKNAPLDLHLEFDEELELPESAERMTLAKRMADSTRVRRLTVSSSSPEDLATIFSVFSKPSAPLLEYLAVSCSGETEDSLLPSEKVWSDVPSLYLLHLVHIFIPTPFLRLPQLTYLQVISPHVTPTWLLHTLENAPNLEYVEARGFSGDHTVPSSTKTIHPPQLTHLILEMFEFRYTNFLEFISLPPKTYFHLIVNPPLSVTGSSWLVAPLQKFLTRRLKDVDHFEFPFSISADRTTFFLHISHSNVLLLPMPIDNDIDTCIDFCASLHVAKVTSLIMSGLTSPDPRWPHLIPLFTNIRSVSMCHHYADMVLTALYNEDPSTDPFCFPHLVEIMPGRGCYRSDILYDRLVDVVQQREAAGKPVRVVQRKDLC